MIRIEMEMPKDCANCPLIFPAKDGVSTPEYFCKVRWEHINRSDLFRRQEWCPMREEQEGTANGSKR